MSETSGFRLEQAALLIVDLISDYSFPDGEALARQALRIVPNVAALAARFREQERPVIYVNDNYGRWRSNFDELINWALSTPLGSEIVKAVRPTRSDYFVLKPRHSAFYETPLPSLLEKLQIKHVAIVGVAGDSCVLYSALDAHTRQLGVWVPSDGTASLSDQRNERVMAYIRESLNSDTTPIQKQ